MWQFSENNQKTYFLILLSLACIWFFFGIHIVAFYFACTTLVVLGFRFLSIRSSPLPVFLSLLSFLSITLLTFRTMSLPPVVAGELRFSQAIFIGSLSFYVLRLIALGLFFSRNSVSSFLQIRESILYLLYFPNFFVGPFLSPQVFIQQLKNPEPFTSFEQKRCAILRISVGIFKVFLIASFCSDLSFFRIENVWTFDGSLWDFHRKTFFLIFTIYFFLSGSTDIALSISRIFGIRLPENFHYPFFASNLEAFWNRWHISVSHWFRDYVFFPLLKAIFTRMPVLGLTVASAISTLVAFVSLGLWNGMYWNWVIYGFIQGFAIIGTRMIRVKLQPITQSFPKLTGFLGCILTFYFIAITTVLALNLDSLSKILGRLMNF